MRTVRKLLEGSGLDRYIELIKEKIKIKVQNKSVLDGLSSCLKYGVNIRALGSIHNTVEYVLFPEIVTRFIMKLKNLNYKNASSLLYGDGKRLLIEHHSDLLLKVCYWSFTD